MNTFLRSASCTLSNFITYYNSLSPGRISQVSLPRTADSMEGTPRLERLRRRKVSELTHPILLRRNGIQETTPGKSRRKTTSKPLAKILRVHNSRRMSNWAFKTWLPFFAHRYYCYNFPGSSGLSLTRIRLCFGRTFLDGPCNKFFPLVSPGQGASRNIHIKIIHVRVHVNTASRTISFVICMTSYDCGLIMDTLKTPLASHISVWSSFQNYCAMKWRVSRWGVEGFKHSIRI